MAILLNQFNSFNYLRKKKLTEKKISNNIMSYIDINSSLIHLILEAVGFEPGPNW